MSSKIDNNYILQDFKLSDWIDAESRLLSKIQNVFEKNVKADMYDVRREQINFLAGKSLFDDTKKNELFSTYYLNDDHSLIAGYVQSLAPFDRKIFDDIQPYRERAFAEIIVTLDKQNSDARPRIDISPQKDFVQGSDDYRKLPRRFAALPDDFLRDRDFVDLVVKVARSIRQKDSSALTFKFEFHVMRLLVRKDPKTNTPEGKHQDGVDYIIMFIANRYNVEGGVSQVFEKKDGGSFVLVKEILLDTGQGLFMSDASSNLYHEVSPFSLVDKNEQGYRDLFGFDISIVRN